MAKQTNTKQQKVEHTNVALPVPARGRVFEGTVTKKFPTRVVIEAERTVYVHKYERFYKKIMRVHARLPAGMNIEVGDYVKVQETRPLSKIIHAIVIGKVRSAHMEKAEAKKQ
jgi:ribosomal protein S17